MSFLYNLTENCARKAASIPPKLAGKIDKSIAFIHLPKCGGTSVHTAISRHYRADHISYLDPTASANASKSSQMEMLAFRKSLLAYELAKQGDRRFISGHWPVDEGLVTAHMPNWAFITILRDPVERWLSNYFFNRHRSDNRNHFGTELDLDAYLDTKDAIENGKLYLSFCNGGEMPEGDLSGPIARAISVFSKFDLIGTLDDMDGFLDGFEKRWKVRPTLSLSNMSPATKPDREKALSGAILERIEQICAPDRQIYDAANRARTPLSKPS